MYITKRDFDSLLGIMNLLESKDEYVIHCLKYKNGSSRWWATDEMYPLNRIKQNTLEWDWEILATIFVVPHWDEV